MVSQKHRPRKRRPQIADLENTDLENAGLENAGLENADLENVACLPIEKLRPFIKSMGEELKTIIRRAFLKRPENFSGPKTFRGSFRVNFSGPGKRFSKRPKTPRILTRVFRVVFSGLQRELDSDLLRT